MTEERYLKIISIREKLTAVLRELSEIQYEEGAYLEDLEEERRIEQGKRRNKGIFLQNQSLA